jgi:hypothetical protein
LKTSDAFKLIVEIENLININVFTWNNFNTWPLIRQILWTNLTLIDSHNIKNNNKPKFLNLKSIKLKLSDLVSGNQIKKDTRKFFISRPQYLQELPNGMYFDRIVDPIIESLNESENITKYYVAKISKEKSLTYNFKILNHRLSFKSTVLTLEQNKELLKIEELLNITNFNLLKKYKKSLRSFSRWNIAARKMLFKCKKLEEIYLTSWYFPDMMGICAAASGLGIKTIDVQHGKQGKYQAMYSGWTKIPKGGYDLMPDNFWCWGQPSCDHILASSPSRSSHIPFIGGYPWIEYYKKKLIPSNFYILDKKIRVLVTLQPPQGDNIERIPNFLIDFLLSDYVENMYFTFRLHPNDATGSDYCDKRLSMIDCNIYKIDSEGGNLYDALVSSTHHITAYSSCCYEADIFGIPTLFFGNEARDIYEEEIQSGVFTWTSGVLSDFNKWLTLGVNIKKDVCKYIKN